jgi:hypothetical protein
MSGRFMETQNKWIEPYRKVHGELIQTSYKHLIDWSQVETTMAFTGFSRKYGLLPEIIGIAGVTPIWSGVAHAWVILGTNVQSHRFFMHRNVGKYLEILAKRFLLKRVQATVPVSSHKNLSWIEVLGFELESKLDRFGPDGKDHFMYRKLYE